MKTPQTEYVFLSVRVTKQEAEYCRMAADNGDGEPPNVSAFLRGLIREHKRKDEISNSMGKALAEIHHAVKTANPQPQMPPQQQTVKPPQRQRRAIIQDEWDAPVRDISEE